MRTVRLAAAIAVLALGVRSTLLAGQQPTPGSLLDAYSRGDTDVVDREFAGGATVAALVPAMRAWAESPAAREWRQAYIILTLDLAAAALREPEPAPDAATAFLDLGRAVALRDDPIALREGRQEEVELSAEFLQAWLETAVAIHVAAGEPARAIEFLDKANQFSGVSITPALRIQRGLAIELLGGEDVTDALEDAVRDYDEAARDADQRAEASARAAHAFNRLERYRDAMRRLDVAGEGTADVVVASWLAHLRGQALDGLGEPALARDAHALASALIPGASEPWIALERGDRRTIEAGLRRLRSYVASTADVDTGARPFLFELFDAYERGQFDAVLVELLGMGSLEEFSNEVRELADRWVRNGPPSETVHRQRVVATVALETARARGLTDWSRAHLLLEWACERLRAAWRPDEFERHWMHAAAAVIAGAVRPVEMEVHVRHALLRIPDDDALAMASAVSAELRAGPDRREPLGLRSPGRALNLATSRLEEAAERAPYRAEAHVRLGYTALRRGREDDALTLLAEAVEAPDPVIRYLALLLRGRAFDKLGRFEEAVGAYEAATATVPGAQTAELGLAAALLRAGDRARSEEIAERALLREATVQDPWLYYGQGDFRLWPELIARLREAMR